MRKYLIILLALSQIFISKAQDTVNLFVKNSTLAATDDRLPFWFSANQHGKIPYDYRFLNISDINIYQDYSEKEDKSFSFTWGGNLIAAFGKTNYYQVNQAFAGVTYRDWEIKGGLFHDPTLYSGLSTTNGNIMRSQNARPYPMLRLSTKGFKPLPFAGNFISFKGEYDEGILSDNRFVNKTHLHHKSFFLQLEPVRTWFLQLGADHYVMWGGTSRDENTGQLPQDISAYWKYILGIRGDEDFPVNDQLNIAGNQLGSYKLEIKKIFPEVITTFYLSHPFEDFSGVNLRNWPDNLLGFHIHIKNKVINDIVYEFTNTRHQSLQDSLYEWNEEDSKWELQETDSYFSNYIYKSGYTYHQQLMGSPLFFPLIKDYGIIKGIRSNRFYAHHFGVSGKFSEYFRWKGLLTFIHHFGTYVNPYDETHKQISALLEFEYNDPGFPLIIGFTGGADAGNSIRDNLGLQLWIAKRITK